MLVGALRALRRVGPVVGRPMAAVGGPHDRRVVALRAARRAFDGDDRGGAGAGLARRRAARSQQPAGARRPALDRRVAGARRGHGAVRRRAGGVAVADGPAQAAGVLALVGAVVALVVALGRGWSVEVLGVVLPPRTFLDLAQLVALILPIAAIIHVGLYQGLRSRDVRRGVGVLWDLGGFWPRWVHPFAPPTYSDRAVTRLQEQLNERHAGRPAAARAPQPGHGDRCRGRARRGRRPRRRRRAAHVRLAAGEALRRALPGGVLASLLRGSWWPAHEPGRARALAQPLPRHRPDRRRDRPRGHPGARRRAAAGRPARALPRRVLGRAGVRRGGRVPAAPAASTPTSRRRPRRRRLARAAGGRLGLHALDVP